MNEGRSEVVRFEREWRGRCLRYQQVSYSPSTRPRAVEHETWLWEQYDSTHSRGALTTALLHDGRDYWQEINYNGPPLKRTEKDRLIGEFVAEVMGK